MSWNHYLGRLAEAIKNLGVNMNSGLQSQFNWLRNRLNPSSDFEKYWLACIETTTWLIGGLTNSRSFKVDVYNATIAWLFKGGWNSWKQHMRNIVMASPYGGTRKNRAVDHLLLHSKVLRDCQSRGFTNILNQNNIVDFQRIVLSTARGMRGVGHWMATIPIKVIVISENYSIGVVNQLEVPLGKNVVEGIRKVIGININQRRKRDIVIAQEIHRHFAKSANTDVFTINSGFWEIGK